ncbi:MAG: NADPH:quinone oxidoreductase family protein [Pseudomonadota bacterium]
MRAVHCVRDSDHTQLELVELPPPGDPAPHQVKIAMSVRGIQFSDLVRIAGNYQVKTPHPFVVGGEGAGTVTAVGDEVSRLHGLQEGDQVICPGGCVEEILVSANAVHRVPAGVDLAAAASFRNNYATAYYGLMRGQLQAGESLLVHGAAGGVGLAAVDLGKLYGASVIGTASADDKLEVVKSMGADHTINYSDGFKDQVKEITGGLGADVIYDPVGGDVFDESVRCIAPFGRILVVGFTSGRSALAKTNHLLVKDASVIGYTLGGLQKHNPQLQNQINETLMGWLASKRINPYISHTLPMSEIEAAYQLIVDRKVVGKVMITND